MTRKEAIRHLEYLKVSYPLADVSEWVDMAIEALKFAKHFDLLKEYQSLQEVVRCKDCKHWYADADTGMACEFTNMGQPEDGYCNWGERKEESEVEE